MNTTYTTTSNAVNATVRPAFKIADGMCCVGDTVYHVFIGRIIPSIVKRSSRILPGYIDTKHRIGVNPDDLFTTAATARAALIDGHLQRIKRAEKEIRSANRALKKLGL